jgi:hypothetical protein
MDDDTNSGTLLAVLIDEPKKICFVKGGIRRNTS